MSSNRRQKILKFNIPHVQIFSGAAVPGALGNYLELGCGSGSLVLSLAQVLFLTLVLVLLVTACGKWGRQKNHKALCWPLKYEGQSQIQSR